MAIMLNLFGPRKQIRDAAERLYAGVMARAREPVFFVSYGVPDTLDGRFDLLTLHAFLVLTHLKTNPAVAQAFIDRLFAGFDEALRHLGSSDMGLPRRLKPMAGAFYGRLQAYEEAGEGLEEALARNLYRGAGPSCIGAMAAYVLGAKRSLSLTAEGEVDFGPLPPARI